MIDGNMNGIRKIELVLDYIEENISEKISCTALAKIATVSDYELRRIFSFIVGLPIGEYIRKRKLSRAVEDIKNGKGSLSEIAIRYGYDSLSSFSRAFKEQYDLTPSQVEKEEFFLSTYNRPSFTFKIKETRDLPFTVKNVERFYIDGVVGESDLDDTVCCENVWAKFEKLNVNGKDVFSAYFNGQENVVCAVGIKTLNKTENTTEISGGKYVCFKADSNAEEKEINEIYDNILICWLPFSSFSRDTNRPGLEIFYNDSDIFEILIPVKDKGE